MTERERQSNAAFRPAALAAAAAIVAATAGMLFLMGRSPWCTCGYVKLWHGVTRSAENSQHIADFYTFSHIIHGFAFYYLLSAPRVPWRLRLPVVVAIESAWEIVENSSFVIDRYREATIALDYYGDSIVNSASDIAFCVLGFTLAARLPVRVTVALTVVMEIVVAYLIRDNLALNILMLLWPLESVRRWQQGA